MSEKIDAALRANIIWMVETMGQIVLPPELAAKARELIPEIRDKIVVAERLRVESVDE